jgi:hypothetical protein
MAYPVNDQAVASSDHGRPSHPKPAHGQPRLLPAQPKSDHGRNMTCLAHSPSKMRMASPSHGQLSLRKAHGLPSVWPAYIQTTPWSAPPTYSLAHYQSLVSEADGQTVSRPAHGQIVACQVNDHHVDTQTQARPSLRPANIQPSRRQVNGQPNPQPAHIKPSPAHVEMARQ